jgi:hypothetical protein
MLTIDTAATKFNLVTVADARSALGLFDRSDDEQLTGFVDRASDVCARHCKRVFAAETVTETFRLDLHQESLILARYPVVGEITSVVENGVTLTTADYEIDAAAGILIRLHSDRPCWWPYGKTVVVYSGGYSLPDDAPEGLRQAALQLVKAYYHGIDRDPLVRSESVDGLSSGTYDTISAGALPHDVRELLGPFRNMRFK